MEAARAYIEVPPVIYPDSDGEPMAENTLQYEWIVTIKGNLDFIFEDAFVAGDLFWYPVKGSPNIRLAPDVMVALGRPKGRRGSYRQWEEGGKAPDVVFEIWSPSNSFAQKVLKMRFYDRFGVSEFYTYDPDNNEFSAFIRENGSLEPVDVSAGLVSPVLGIHFEPGPDTLTVRGPDGRAFRTFAEIVADGESARHEAESARHEAESARHEAESAAARAEALAAKLRALGLDPDAP